MRLFLALLLMVVVTPALARTERGEAPRGDGTMIDYTLFVPDEAPAGLLLFAQGSGCEPVAGNGNFAVARAAFPRHLVLAVEKYGIAPDADIVDGARDCPAAFFENYTVSGRVADYETVLAALGSDLPLTLFGGSEGGIAVAMLSARVPAAAAIIVSSATGVPFAEVVLGTVPPEGQATVRAAFDAARAAPRSSEIFAGSSYRFWADMLDRVAADDMLSSDTPFLLIQGGRDASSPPGVGRATVDRFAAAGRCSVDYWEFPALDHGMVDPAGRSHMAAIAAAAARWAETAAELAPVCR